MLNHMIFAHRPLIAKAENVVQSQPPVELSPRRRTLFGWPGEAFIVGGEIDREHRVGLLHRRRAGQPQFADQPVLKGPPHTFNASFGLWRTRGDRHDAQFLQRPSQLRQRLPAG